MSTSAQRRLTDFVRRLAYGAIGPSDASSVEIINSVRWEARELIEAIDGLSIKSITKPQNITARPLSVREFAQMKGCSTKWIYDLLYSGRILGAEKVGRVWRIPRSAVRALGAADPSTQERKESTR